MKKLLFFAALVCCQMVSAAKGTPKDFTSYQLGDTVLYYQHNQTEKAKKAKKQILDSYGIVKHVEELDNVAKIHIFDAKDSTLIAVRTCIASGEDFNKRKGEQLYFYPDGAVKQREEYSLVPDEKSGMNRSVPRSETLLYPNGLEQETVTFIGNKWQGNYDRKGYYPSGALQFHERSSEKDFSVTFYEESGIEVKKTPKGYVRYMTMPEFKGGQEGLLNFLSQAVQYPKECQKNRIQGRVICSFFVNTDGKIEGVKVLKSGGHPLLDNEAMRVIRSMPKWKPGTKRGEPTRIRFTVPVIFKLQ